MDRQGAGPGRGEGYLSSVEQLKVETEAATKLNLGSGLCLDSSLVVQFRGTKKTSMCLFQPTLRLLPPRLYPIAASSHPFSLARAYRSYPFVDTLSLCPFFFIYLHSVVSSSGRRTFPSGIRALTLSLSLSLSSSSGAITPSSLKRLTRVLWRFQLHIDKSPCQLFRQFCLQSLQNYLIKIILVKQ